MTEIEIFLKALKEANGNNPILNTLKPDGVDFIDYKNIGDKVIDGIQVNSTIRLKTLPKSGFVGSRKIFYTKLKLQKIYPLVEEYIILVSEQADIRELIGCLIEQTGINIDISTIGNKLDTKLVFDENKCGSVVLYANPKSIFIDGKITIRYTCNKYRVLNYVKNRVIVLSEKTVMELTNKPAPISVMANYYYNDAANFPVDHEIFMDLDLLTHDSINNKKLEYDRENNKYVEIAPRTFAFGNMPEYFRFLMVQVGNDMERGKTYWRDDTTYNLKKVIQVYLKWYTQEQLYFYNETLPEDGRDYVNRSKYNSLDCLDFFFIGKTVDLIKYLKEQYPDFYFTGNCGININFEYICAFQFISSPPAARTIKKGTILPIYWGIA